MYELEALVCLTAIPHLGPVRCRQLIDCFGSATQALQATSAQIAQLPGFGAKLVEAWEQRWSQLRWRESLKLAQEQQVRLISWQSPHYPAGLAELPDAPLLLYIRGELPLQELRAIAIVGTRQASNYGMEMAFRLAQELANRGWVVVSGLARGIDTAAHRGALSTGATLAVIGSGLAQLYPPENRALAQRIAQNGALISEFAMQQPPDRGQFPQRNRLVSGLTVATLLIESPLQGGAMLTMERAAQQQRPCFALPGRADNDQFRGNHLLIKQGRAQLVESSLDIIQALEASAPDARCPAPTKPIATTQQLPLPLLSDAESQLLAQLGAEELTIDELLSRTQLPVQKLQVLIMSLVLKKIIQEYPGKIYKRRASNCLQKSVHI